MGHVDIARMLAGEFNDNIDIDVCIELARQLANDVDMTIPVCLHKSRRPTRVLNVNVCVELTS